MNSKLDSLKHQMEELTKSESFSFDSKLNGDELQKFLNEKKELMMKKFELAKAITEETFKELKEKEYARHRRPLDN